MHVCVCGGVCIYVLLQNKQTNKQTNNHVHVYVYACVCVSVRVYFITVYCACVCVHTYPFLNLFGSPNIPKEVIPSILNCLGTRMLCALLGTSSLIFSSCYQYCFCFVLFDCCW